MINLDDKYFQYVFHIGRQTGRGSNVKYMGSLSTQNTENPENTRIRFQTTIDAEDADVCLNCTLPHCNGSEECYKERKKEKEKRNESRD